MSDIKEILSGVTVRVYEEGQFDGRTYPKGIAVTVAGSKTKFSAVELLALRHILNDSKVLMEEVRKRAKEELALQNSFMTE